MKINIKTKAHLSENTTKLDFTKSSNINEIEKMFEQRITNLVQTSLDRIKNDDCSDVFGFGELINGKYPKLWTEVYQKNWREVLPKVTVKLSCKVEITEIGFDAKSIQLGEEDFLK
jgi:spore germination protein KC